MTFALKLQVSGGEPDLLDFSRGPLRYFSGKLVWPWGREVVVRDAETGAQSSLLPVEFPVRTLAVLQGIGNNATSFPSDVVPDAVDKNSIVLQGDSSNGTVIFLR